MGVNPLPLPEFDVDPLTGLGTHRAFASKLEHALAETAHSCTQVAVLIMDLDGMYRFNQEHGHDAGDAALRIIARRLREIAPHEGVYRLGGDEFGIIHQGIQVRQEAVSLADRILRQVKVEFGVPEPPEGATDFGRLHLACTVGIALSTGGSTLDRLIGEADWAMQFGKAKYGVRFGSLEPSKSGDQYVVFDDLRPEQVGPHLSTDTGA